MAFFHGNPRKCKILENLYSKNPNKEIEKLENGEIENLPSCLACNQNESA